MMNLPQVTTEWFVRRFVRNISQINQFYIHSQKLQVYFAPSCTNSWSFKLRKSSRCDFCSHIAVIQPMKQSFILSAKIHCPVAQQNFSFLSTPHANQSYAYLILFFYEGTTRYQCFHNFQMMPRNCKCKCCTSTLQENE